MGLGKMLTGLFKKEREDDAQEKEIKPGGVPTGKPATEDMYITGTMDVPEKDTSSGMPRTENIDVSGDGNIKNTECQETLSEFSAGKTEGTGELTEEKILEVLSQVYDPEIPIDIVNLGLVYRIEIQGARVRIDMTMTAPGCPASTQIAAESRMMVEDMPGVESCEIEIVWDPPWDPSKMSEEAQQSMGIF